MPAYQDPIPLEALPPGWGPAEYSDGRVAYRHGSPSIELVAVRTTADHCHPALGLGRCWELRFRHLAGDLPITERIGRVTTRSAAVDGLLRCMHCVHDDVGASKDPVAVREALENVRFSCFVPADVDVVE